MDNVSLLPIFEPTVSPRNVVIVATKTCDGDGMAWLQILPEKKKPEDKIPPGEQVK